MSKIGQKPIQVPASVQVEINDNVVTAKGSKGQVQCEYPSFLTVKREGEQLIVTRGNDSKRQKAAHGLFRSLIANAVQGVDTGWTKKLQIVGTGFNGKMQGQSLALKLGYSHPVIFNPVEGVQLSMDGNTSITVSGADKQLVGQVAYQIKILRKPDIYKGKGIRYEGEQVRTKQGKKAKA